MQNYVQDGKVLSKINGGAALVSGEVEVLGEMIGVSQGDCANGELGNFVVEGVVRLSKKAALALSLGDKVYWDKVALEITNTASSDADIFAGFVAKDADAADTEVNVKLGGVTPTKVGAVAAIGVTGNLSALVPVAAALTALVPVATALTASNFAAVDPAHPTKAEIDAGIDAVALEVETAFGLKADNADVETLRGEIQTGFDLKADNADVETLRGQVEARLDAIEAKVDALIAAMKASLVMDN